MTAVRTLQSLLQGQAEATLLRTVPNVTHLLGSCAFLILLLLLSHQILLVLWP